MEEYNMVFHKKTDNIPNSGGSVLGSITIEWEDQFKQNNVMWKVPRLIRFNDNIVVREDEIAVFYRDGKALAYIDKPGRYALTDLNAPVVGEIVKLLTGIQQQAEVYYLQRRFFDIKFGSAETLWGFYILQIDTSKSRLQRFYYFYNHFFICCSYWYRYCIHPSKIFENQSFTLHDRK